MKKRLAFAFFLCAFLVLPVFGAFSGSLSIQIIQNNPGQEKIWDISYLLEQRITDYFFEKGQIVSSSPIWISDTEAKNNGAFKAALAENLEGGMEYLVRIEVFYAPASETSNPQALLLDNVKKIQWKTYLVKTGLEVASGSAAPGNLTMANNNESGLSDFADFVADKINIGLKNAKNKIN